MMRRLVAPVIAAALGTLVACAAQQEGQESVERLVTTTTVAPKFVKITEGNRFEPNPLEVPAPFEVVWVNEDVVPHTVTSGTREAPDGRFDSQLEKRGNSLAFKFDTAGTYPFFCRIHPEMNGQITVT